MLSNLITSARNSSRNPILHWKTHSKFEIINNQYYDNSFIQNNIIIHNKIILI